MKIERDKVYLTRCGEKVRVVCVDAGEQMPIVGLDEDQNAMRFQASGAFFNGTRENVCDLVSEYVEPPKPREVWVYVDGSEYGCVYNNPKPASDEHAAKLVKFREVIEA